MSMPILRPAVVLALSLLIPFTAGCNACSNEDDAAASAEKERRRSADPLGDVRRKPKTKLNREEMKAAKMKRKSEGKSPTGSFSAISTPEAEREVAPEVAAARDLVLSGDDAKVGEGRLALDTWLGTHPEDADAFYWRGRSWTAALEHEKAIADYNAAGALDADWVNVYKWLALASFQNDGCEVALPALDRVVELQPAVVVSYTERAQCRTRVRQLDGALEDLKKACELEDTQSCARVTRMEKRVERRKSRERFGNE
jgi:hypothetical protein